MKDKHYLLTLYMKLIPTAMSKQSNDTQTSTNADNVCYDQFDCIASYLIRLAQIDNTDPLLLWNALQMST